MKQDPIIKTPSLTFELTHFILCYLFGWVGRGGYIHNLMFEIIMELNLSVIWGAQKIVSKSDFIS